MVFLLIAGFLVIIALEVPAMRLRGQTGELKAFWVLLALGFALSLAAVENWPVPSPISLLRTVFDPVSNMLGIQ